MLNGLDLFSGIGGLSVALSEWVRPIAYCEIDPYCQGVLITKISQKLLHDSPIWDDVRTLDGWGLYGMVDIIYGGFPCQDISVAGRREGLAGKQSGLFYEILRLCRETQCRWVFLENVPGIISLGGSDVVRELTSLGYDCRWCVISAASVGALHRRERWFLLAHTNSNGCHELQIERIPKKTLSDPQEGKKIPMLSKRMDSSGDVATISTSNPNLKAPLGMDSKSFTDAPRLRRIEGSSEGIHSEREAIVDVQPSDLRSQVFVDWENTEPPVCGVAHGLPNRVDRIRVLGNAVVPCQAKEAFKILMGLK